MPKLTTGKPLPFQSKHDELLHHGSVLVTDELLIDLGLHHANYNITATIVNRISRPLLAPRKSCEVLRSTTIPGAFSLQVAAPLNNDANLVAAIADYVTIAALPAYTQAGAGAGATLTANANGILTVDGVDTVLGDLILVKDGADPEDNGLYEVTTEGTGGVAFILTRQTDHDTDAEVTSGDWLVIASGLTQAGRAAAITTLGAIIVDTTGIIWELFDWTDIQVEFIAIASDGVS